MKIQGDSLFYNCSGLGVCVICEALSVPEITICFSFPLDGKTWTGTMVCVDVVMAPVLGTSEPTRDTRLVKMCCVDPDCNFFAKS